jgi:predicted anti-sigma-YlaC factor YlaD
MQDKHLQAPRGWALVRNKLQLTLSEAQHLQQCDQCHDWFSGFTEMARRAGFEIAYTVPKFEKKGKAPQAMMSGG